jgi:hypothetical protein
LATRSSSSKQKEKAKRKQPDAPDEVLNAKPKKKTKRKQPDAAEEEEKAPDAAEKRKKEKLLALAHATLTLSYTREWWCTFTRNSNLLLVD